MGRLRPVRRSYRRLDLLARDDTSYTMAEVAGRHQRPVGKTRITPARNNRELAAESKEAEFLFCVDAFSGARHIPRKNSAGRARALSAQLQPLS